MAQKKTTTKKSKKAPEPAVRKRSVPREKVPHGNDRLAGARKIGARQETVTEFLSPSQIEGERLKVCDSLREIDRVEAEHKTATANAKAKIATLKETKSTALRNANAGKRDVEITVEEWLDGRNQVIRVRTDSGEIIGDRTARVEELQENLFDEVDEDEDGGEDDDGEAATTSDTPPDPDGDFGDVANP